MTGALAVLLAVFVGTGLLLAAAVAIEARLLLFVLGGASAFLCKLIDWERPC